MSRRRRKNLPVPRRPAQGDTLGALRPFANVELPKNPSGEDVWLYVGKADPSGNPPHLKLEDFRRARRALGIDLGAA